MEIDEVLTMEEIKERFDKEWVLINDPETDEQMRVLRGRVRYHSPNKAELYENARRLQTKRNAIHFIGTPENPRMLL